MDTNNVETALLGLLKSTREMPSGLNLSERENPYLHLPAGEDQMGPWKGILPL